MWLGVSDIQFVDMPCGHCSSVFLFVAMWIGVPRINVCFRSWRIVFFITRYEQWSLFIYLILFLKKLASAKYTTESRLPCDWCLEESWLPGLFVTIKFFCKPVLMLVPSTPRSRLSGDSRLPGVFVTGESFWTPGNRFTDFKEHTTIFKGTIILKIDCRLL
jgi:hypothetical protein